MLDTKYAFISAYLKGEEAKIVTSDYTDRLLKASSVQDVFGVISDTDIGTYLGESTASTFDEVDERLWLYFNGCLERIKFFKTVPDDVLKILNAYLVKYDVLNIKAALQNITSGKKVRMIPMGIIHNDGLSDELYNAEDTDSIIGLLNRCRLSNYASILGENKTEEGISLTLLTGTRLDGEYYRGLQNIVRRVKDGSTLSKAYSILVDMTNLQVVTRAVINELGTKSAEATIAGGYIVTSGLISELLSLKLADMPGRLGKTPYQNVVEEIVSSYNSTKSIIVVDEVINKYKFSLTAEILSPKILSPAVIAWYLILKEVEIRNLRLILKAMFDNVPLGEIKTYLVLAS